MTISHNVTNFATFYKYVKTDEQTGAISKHHNKNNFINSKFLSKFSFFFHRNFEFLNIVKNNFSLGDINNKNILFIIFFWFYFLF